MYLPPYAPELNPAGIHLGVLEAAETSARRTTGNSTSAPAKRCGECAANRA